MKKVKVTFSGNLGIESRITEFFMKTLLLNFDWISNIFLITLLLPYFSVPHTTQFCENLSEYFHLIISSIPVSYRYYTSIIPVWTSYIRYWSKNMDHMIWFIWHGISFMLSPLMYQRWTARSANMDFMLKFPTRSRCFDSVRLGWSSSGLAVRPKALQDGRAPSYEVWSMDAWIKLRWPARSGQGFYRNQYQFSSQQYGGVL